MSFPGKFWIKTFLKGTEGHAAISHLETLGTEALEKPLLKGIWWSMVYLRSALPKRATSSTGVTVGLGRPQCLAHANPWCHAANSPLLSQFVSVLHLVYLCDWFSMATFIWTHNSNYSSHRASSIGQDWPDQEEFLDWWRVLRWGKHQVVWWRKWRQQNNHLWSCTDERSQKWYGQHCGKPWSSLYTEYIQYCQ